MMSTRDRNPLFSSNKGDTMDVVDPSNSLNGTQVYESESSSRQIAAMAARISTLETELKLANAKLDQLGNISSKLDQLIAHQGKAKHQHSPPPTSPLVAATSSGRRGTTMSTGTAMRTYQSFAGGGLGRNRRKSSKRVTLNLDAASENMTAEDFEAAMSESGMSAGPSVGDDELEMCAASILPLAKQGRALRRFGRVTREEVLEARKGRTNDEEEDSEDTDSGEAKDNSASAVGKKKKRFFWDKPLHTDGAVSTAIDLAFVFGAVCLCILHLSAVSPKASDYFPPDDIAPWYFVLPVTVGEAMTGLWMWIKSATREGGTGWLSDSVRVTRHKYIRSYFLLDLIYALPLELCFMAIPRVSYWLAIRHWLRWIRVITLRQSDNPFSGSRSKISFSAFIGLIVVVQHFIAEIAWITFDINADVDGEPLTYLEALYWVISTSTSTGYGDISPKTDGPRVFAMFAMLSGGLIVSGITAFATSLLTVRDPLGEEHDKKKTMMNSMLQHYQIPWELRQSVISLFPRVLQTQSESQFKSMLESLPPALSRNLTQYVQANMVKNVSVFQDVEDVNLLLPLVERLQQKFVEPQEVIIEQGTASDEMYFLIFGTAQVIRKVNEEEEVVLSSLYSGTIFGELGVLNGSRRHASVVATSSCELMVLSKEDFNTVINNTELGKLIEDRMDAYCATDKEAEAILDQAEQRQRERKSIGAASIAQASSRSTSIASSSARTPLEEVDLDAEDFGNPLEGQLAASARNPMTSPSPRQDAFAAPPTHVEEHIDSPNLSDEDFSG